MLYFLYGHEEKVESSHNPSTSLKLNKIENLPLLSKKPSNKQKPSDQANAVNTAHSIDSIPQASCITYEQFDADPRQETAIQWIEATMGVDKATLANIYAYSSEQDLLYAANQGDSTAMLALGINYKWQATHENFQSNVFRLNELPGIEYRKKAFDKDIMTQARYWLMQAALNNQLLGLSEIAFSYFEERASSDDPEVKKSLEIKGIAYFVLVDSMQPIADQLVTNRFDFSDDSDKQKLLKQERTDLIAKWQDDRMNLGMSTETALNPPEEIKEYFRLQQNLCQEEK
jgi:hypothetical protein